MRKAFTLIELLVVIAIIAILAAILFPVFAQAKAAAKAAASLSNAKQHALAIIMYGGDNEDYFPMETAWNTGNDPLIYPGVGTFSSWGWSIQPYMKNGGLFHDPLAAPNSIPAGFPEAVYDSYYSQYGLNYTYLTPEIITGGPGGGPYDATTSMTTPANPAETVMIVSKWANAENTTGYDWGTNFTARSDGTMWGVLFACGAEGVDCGDLPDQYCATNWGVGGFFDTTGLFHLPTKESGTLTGGDSRRQALKHVISWVDGHASKLSAAALAAGTNWTETQATGSVTITDCTGPYTLAGCGSQKYLWDLQ